MINEIQTVITQLSTFPDRPNYKSAREYAASVAVWLRENKALSIALATLVPELNEIIVQLNSTTVHIEEMEDNVKNIRQIVAQSLENIRVEEQKVLNAISLLPPGTINDVVVSASSTYSSIEIERIKNRTKLAHLMAYN